MKTVVIFILLLFISQQVFSACVTEEGTENLIAEGYLDTDIQDPKIDSCMLKGTGIYFSVWTLEDPILSPHPSTDIFLEISKFTTTFQVLQTKQMINDVTDLTQQNPSISCKDDGFIVIAWESENQDGSSYGVISKLYKYDEDTNEFTQRGEEFIVNVHRDSDQGRPSVEFIPQSNRFVVTWSGSNQDIEYSTYEVYAQVFDYSLTDASLTPTPFSDQDQKINENVEKTQWKSHLTVVESGDVLLVLWESNEVEDKYGVFGRVYDISDPANGLSVPLTNEFALRKDSEKTQWDSHAAASSVVGSKLIGIVYSYTNEENSNYDVYMDLIDLADPSAPNMEVVPEPVLVNVNLEHGQTDPKIAFLEELDVAIVTWTSDFADGSGYLADHGVFGRVVDCRDLANNGIVFDEEEFPVHTSLLGDQTSAFPLTLRTSSFVVHFYSRESFVNDQHQIKSQLFVIGEDEPQMKIALVDQTAELGFAGEYIFDEGTFYDPYHLGFDYTASIMNDQVWPTWLSFEEEERKFSWLPTLDVCSANIQIVVNATNYCENYVWDDFVLTVTPNKEPIAHYEKFEDQLIIESTMGWSWDLPTEPTVAFEDPELGTLSYSVVQIIDGAEETKPDWLSIDETTGSLSGDVPENCNQIWNLEIVASDVCLDVGLTPIKLYTEENFPPVAHYEKFEDILIEGGEMGWSWDLPTDPTVAFEDPELGALSYSVVQIIDDAEETKPDWLSIDEITGSLSGDVPYDCRLAWNLEIVASDECDLTARTSLFFDIGANNPPIVHNEDLGMEELTAGEMGWSWDLPEGVFEDPKGEAFTYSYEQILIYNGLPSDWLSIDETTGSLSGDVPDDCLASTEIEIIATDVCNHQVRTKLALKVGDNQPPVNNFEILEPQEITPGTEDWSWEQSDTYFTDPEGGSLRYLANQADEEGLPEWMSIDESSGTLSGDVTDECNLSYDIELYVLDECNHESGIITKTFYMPENKPPDNIVFPEEIELGSNENFSENFDKIFFDPENGPLTYKIELTNGDSLPEWGTYTEDGQFSVLTPSECQDPLDIIIYVTDDCDQTINRTFNFIVTNEPPVVNPDKDFDAPLVDKPQDWSYQFDEDMFLGPESEPLRYTVSPLNSWMEFDSDTRTFTGISYSEERTDYYITITAYDTCNQTASREMLVSYVLYNKPPVMNETIGNQLVYANNEWIFEIPAGAFYDPEGYPLDFTATQFNGETLDDIWISFDPATRVFSGMSPVECQGSYGITLTVTDDLPQSISHTFYVSVINHPPQVNNKIPAQYTYSTVQWNMTIPSDTFIDYNNEELQYTATLHSGDPLPDEIKFDSNTHEFVAFFEETCGDNYNIKISVEDQCGFVQSHSFELVVENQVPYLQDGIPDQILHQITTWELTFDEFLDLETSSADLIYRATLQDGGDLPGWISFDGVNRIFSGAPEELCGPVYPIRLYAKDECDQEGYVDFSVSTGQQLPPALVNQELVDQVITPGGNLSYLPFKPEYIANPDSNIDWDIYEKNDEWPEWLHLDTETMEFYGQGPTDVCHIEFIIVIEATDECDYYGIDEFTVAVTNTPPQLNKPIGEIVILPDVYWIFNFYQTMFISTDGDELEFTAEVLNREWPEWLSFEPWNRRFEGTPSYEKCSTNTFEIKLTANDKCWENLVSDTFNLVLQNEPPQLANPIPKQTAPPLSEWSFEIPQDTFTHRDDLYLEYSLTNAEGTELHDWINFDNETGSILAYTPEVCNTTYTFRVIAQDDCEDIGETYLELQILNQEPFVNIPIPSHELYKDEEWTYTFPEETFIDLDTNDTLSYTATLDTFWPLPGWLNFDPLERTFSGTPTDYQTYHILVTATDSCGNFVWDNFCLNCQGGATCPFCPDGNCPFCEDICSFPYPLPGDNCDNTCDGATCPYPTPVPKPTYDDGCGTKNNCNSFSLMQIILQWILQLFSFQFPCSSNSNTCSN
ncbi:dystroglycan-related [Anaeramoeba flamelloides]|uniref:Dystroglycan-related n=1 Tax=Anaeramoeba flamelloides TaxID=1746091 RepID=A0ABQ8XRP3_9EUKA|nr:dystroglycan-related [Anaeramoeba flamelloides]